ncbi:MAG: MFS transporter [Alphaproteobacteria bacterium]|nr:MFS transporter [Alphaproteobacteria bacterium]
MSAKSNINKLYALIAAQNALTIVPVFVPFMQSHGLDLKEIFFLQGIYSLTLVLIDLPTGYFADVLSRRLSLIIGAIFLCISGVFYVVGTGFWHFCLMEVTFGIGIAFNSGSVQALTYDSLAERGDIKNYRKVCSHQAIVGFFSVATSGVLGGWIAEWNLQAAGMLMLPFFIIALLISMTISEPQRHSCETEKPLNGVLGVLGDTMLRCPPLCSIVFVYALTASMTFALIWFAQPYQTAINIPLSYFGILNVISMLGLMAASKLVHLLEARVDSRKLLLGILIIVIASFFVLGARVSPFGLGLLLMARATFGALDPLTTDMINKLTDSSRRATVLSVRSFVYNVMFTALTPLLGYAANAFSLNEALLFIGIGGGILAIPSAALLRRSWKEMPA